MFFLFVMKMISVYVIGMGTVGKSSLTLRFINDIFIDAYDPTIEDSYQRTYTIDNVPEKLEIYDTAGQDEYKTMRHHWAQNGDAFIVVYSIASRISFDEVETRILELKEVRNEHTLPFIIVGNKCDLTSADRKVTYEEGSMLAEKWDCPFFETSAKDDIHVEDAFYTVVREVRNMHLTNRIIESKPKPKRCTIQ